MQPLPDLPGYRQITVTLHIECVSEYHGRGIHLDHTVLSAVTWVSLDVRAHISYLNRSLITHTWIPAKSRLNRGNVTAVYSAQFYLVFLVFVATLLCHGYQQLETSKTIPGQIHDE